MAALDEQVKGCSGDKDAIADIATTSIVMPLATCDTAAVGL
jgi:hypothetical protein